MKSFDESVTGLINVYRGIFVNGDTHVGSSFGNSIACCKSLGFAFRTFDKQTHEVNKKFNKMKDGDEWWAERADNKRPAAKFYHSISV